MKVSKIQPGSSYQTIISEFAIEQLFNYRKRSPNNEQRIDTILNEMVNGRSEKELIKISDMQRPIWSLSVDDDHTIYFSYGFGYNLNELRIIYFGSPISNDSEELKRLSILSGELSYSTLPENLNIEIIKKNCKLPDLPERLLISNDSIDKYLSPSDEELSEAIDKIDKTGESLNGQTYRLLTSIKPAVDLPVRLSPQQERVISTPLPIFLQGVAGSGKTSILAHYAHRILTLTNSNSSIIIVAYTEQLKAFILTILKTLQDIHPVELSKISVYTWHQMCDFLATEAEMKPFNWVSETFFIEFLHSFLSNKMAKKEIDLIAFEIQEFIWDTIKGNSTESLLHLPDRIDFLAMGKIHLDKKIERSVLYDLIQAYLSSLHNNGLVDKIDPVKRFDNQFHKIKKYDFVLVDEIQDYAFAQLMLLVKLCKNFNGIFFTGDMNQVLYPTQFSWEKVRSAVWEIWKIKAPHEIYIDYNYRNPRPIIEMANALLEIRGRFLEHTCIQNILSNQPLTPRPIRLTAKQGDLDFIIRELASQIGSFGVIQEEIDEMLINGVRLERIFTPISSKGLEFNVVCLVNFNEFYQELTQSAQKYSKRQFSQKVNEIYVAITRTRAQLILLDRAPKGIWSEPELAEHIDFEKNKDALINIVTARFQNRTREDWEYNAKDFESQKAFAAAGECWERANKPLDAARNYEKAERWQKALVIYKSFGQHELCAEVYIKLGKFEDAAARYEEAGQLEKAATLLIEKGRFLKAGQLLLERAEKTSISKDWEKAGLCFEKAREFGKGAECYQKANRFEKAALCFEESKQFTDSALIWISIGKKENAAECYFKSKDFLKAAALFQECHEWKRAGEIWEKAGDYYRGATCYRDAKEFFKSAQCFEKHENWLAAGDEYEKAGKIDAAIKNYIKAEAFEKAAGGYEKTEQWLDAAINWEKFGNIDRAILNYSKSKSYKKVAERLEKLGKWREAAEQWDNIKQFKRAANCFEKCNKWIEAASEYEKDGDLDNALRMYQEAGSVKDIARLLEKNNQIENAAEYLEKHEKWREAAQIFEKIKNYERAAVNYIKSGDNIKAGLLFLKTAKNWHSVLEKTGELHDFKKAAICFIEAQKDYRPGSVRHGATEIKMITEKWRDAARENRDGSQKCFEVIGIIHQSERKYLSAAKYFIIARQIKKALFCIFKAIYDN